jgi:hypothetical protein
MQVLKWLECLMFIPIFQWLRSWGLSIVNFTDSWDFVVVRSFLSSRWSVLLSFWRQKGYHFKVLLKRTIGLVLKEKFLFGISAFWHFQSDFALGHVSGELPVSPLVLSLSLFSLSVFLCFFVLLWGLLLASSMAESSCCFWNCSRNSVRRMVLVPM